MRKTIASLLLLFLATQLTSAPVYPDLAGRVAVNFYHERSGGLSLQITSVTPVLQGTLPLLYIINGAENQGFVLVSGDDRVLAVPGYSLVGNYQQDASMQPAGFRALMDHYLNQIRYHIEQNLPATAEAVASWSHYGNMVFSPSQIFAVPPLLGSIEWGQGCYYNASCPYDAAAGSGYCNRVPVGCVATAMCQVMKYYGHPAQGTGSNSYYHPTYGTLTANFGSSTYNWSLMPASISAANAEIAKISYHAAVSVDMNFGPQGSGSYASDARDALVNNFGYQSTASLQAKQSWPDPTWDLMMTTEMDNGRPLIYRGNNALQQDGHAWVIDGYQGASNNHYHCNWGWNGYQNGYFYLNNLTASGYNFSYDQGAIFGIIPLVPLPPVAGFTANNTSVYTGQQVTFTNQSTGSPTSFKWYFGDGDSSVVMNPTHTYTTAGQFTVTLVVTNAGGTDTHIKTNYITVSLPPAPTADFTAAPIPVPQGDAIQFTDNSANFPASWIWYFGDTQTSQLSNPQHIYQDTGVYSVALKVSNYGGTDSLMKLNYITVTQALPAVNFVANPAITYPGDTIHFTDLTQFDPIAWYWDFGDGQTSTLQHPWHVYTQPGSYTVTLDATNSIGSKSKTVLFYIYIIPPPPLPIAWFVAAPTTILKGESVIFSDFSMSNPVAWQWSFPGGVPSTSGQQNPPPVVYPNAGSFDVLLVVTNLSGADTMLRENYITVGTAGIESAESRNEATIYPNPADDLVQITTATPCTSVSLLDLTGKTILTRDVHNTRFSLHLPEEIPSGTYMIQLHGTGNVTNHLLLIYRN
ncbi:MAG TPA: PKD domain-containing protein [Bacteroidales bacterium]|nr:PKD domain-containing protein [Bacteroidales bacterium]HRZ48925.1 PKD domain-containing protein [Bacteroidales bacterium]